MKASASATAFSAMSSARACCCISSRREEENPGKAYKTVRAELDAYGHGLAEKPEIVALSKVDTLDAGAAKKKAASLKRAAGRAPLLLSAVTGEGVEAVLRALIDEVQQARDAGAGRRGDRVALAGLARCLRSRITGASPSRSARRCSSTAATGLKRDWLASLAEDIAALSARGAEILVVSSGAIALGRTILGLGRKTLKLEESQAAAAVGQIALAGAWSEALGQSRGSSRARSC